MNSDFEEMKKSIIEKAKNRGFATENIGYEEFLELYEPYKEELTEVEFAEILGINYNGWQTIRNKGGKTKALRESLEKISEESKNRIREEIRSRGYNTNTTINYEEFLRLYEPYRLEITEPDFAEIIGITYTNWSNMRNAGSRVNILKEQSKTISEEREKEIEYEIRNQGYTNVLIDYEEFLKLYEPYKEEVTEQDFARILGIININWQNMRKRGIRARILKEKSIIGKKAISSSINFNRDTQKQDEIENQIHEETTPVEVMQVCLQNGMNREEAIDYCMERFGLTQEELLEIMTQSLLGKKELRRTQEGQVYLGEDRE